VRRWQAAIGGIGILVVLAFVVRAFADGDGGASSRWPAQDPDVGMSRYQEIACADQIVVGRTTGVVPGSTEGTKTVTFAVQEWIKPASGPATITLKDTPDPTVDGEAPDWSLPFKRLLFVPAAQGEMVGQYTDQAISIDPQVAQVRKDLPKGLAATCPSWAR
jgi:hypothetical protein